MRLTAYEITATTILLYSDNFRFDQLLGILDDESEICKVDFFTGFVEKKMVVWFDGSQGTEETLIFKKPLPAGILKNFLKKVDSYEISLRTNEIAIKTLNWNDVQISLLARNNAQRLIWVLKCFSGATGIARTIQESQTEGVYVLDLTNGYKRSPHFKCMADFIQIRERLRKKHQGKPF